ncbi:hypothetical protein SPFM1_00027 [Salmonella phage SPFM1]|nr:hypothetical protein SPFM1_00027 [Salmonella phage SPFM1]
MLKEAGVTIDYRRTYFLLTEPYVNNIISGIASLDIMALYCDIKAGKEVLAEILSERFDTKRKTLRCLTPEELKALAIYAIQGQLKTTTVGGRMKVVNIAIPPITH